MRKFIFVIILLVALALACNLSGDETAAPQPAGSTPGPGVVVQSTESVIESPGEELPTAALPLTEPPTPTPIPSDPISVRLGLNSLNSYSMVVEWKTSDLTPENESRTRLEIQASQEQDSQIMHTFILVPADEEEEGSEPSQTDTYAYSIGAEQCSGSDADGWDFQTYSPQEKEMLDLLSEMVDMLPIIDDPVYVGPETMNGILSNHFTFQVSGLGAESGTVVNLNQGDYWLAQDGQYIVRYVLLVETVDANTLETIHTEFLIDLTSANQPVSIAFPQGCLDAKANP
jgi:hypothetical protein